MQMLFLNSLEKKVGEDRVRSAQVSIGEDQGRWFVAWQETKEDGTLHHEDWYEGTGWEEMMTVFREQMMSKQSGGFQPMLDVVMLPELASLDSRSAQVQLLHYYSEFHSNEALYEELRQWRLKQANKEGRAPYLVATNRLLRLICTFLPQTVDELRQLPGLGANKATLYGEELIGFTQMYTQSQPFPLHWVEAEINPVQFNAWLQHEKERKRQVEQSKQEQKRKLLEAITRGDGLEDLREQTQLQRRELMLLMEELDREGYDLEPYIVTLLQDVPTEEQEIAWAAFELQGDRYLKPILQTLYKDQEEMDYETRDRIYEWLRLLRMKFRRAQGISRAEAV
ncbi:HRDC domain-containing protein [Paenibacillus rigui]|uniref:Aldolase n=1 Tax=Paenibacillus rigui TaxID=554312 RepID=A0A229UTF6_9BACL|nr:HRDC domain-containing protein [Paenibacillus rigui]OXM86640.1 aldolase [Paenibacillus rigui]